MKYKVGFIGVGNMGGALLEAASKTICADEIAIYDINTDLAEKKATMLGVNSIAIEEVAKHTKFLFVGVKPNIIVGVLEQIKEFLSEETIIVSMAAGVSIDVISNACKSNRVIRIMPNTPVTAGTGLILYSLGEGICDEDIRDFVNIMCNAGKLDKIDEKLIDAAAALSGCGPAFVYMFIDALADGAVKCGLSREKAVEYAKQTVYGSAYFSMQTDKHLEKLKDEVCSPGGTTIEGVIALEKGSFRHTASSAVIAAFDKTKFLQK